MRKFKLLLPVLFLALFSHAFGQIKVTHVNPSTAKPTGDGLVYTLPRTIIKVDITITGREYLKGPLSEFAKKYFGIEDAITYDYTTWEIENVKLGTVTEPDPGQVYYIQAASPSSKDLKTLIINLNEKGYLAGVNSIDPEFLGDEDIKQVEVIEEYEIQDGPAGFIIDRKVVAKVDTIIRKVAVDTNMTEKLFFRSRISDRSDEELALEAMNKIEGLREARYKLLTGYQETAYSAGTIAYMDGELKKMENEYMALFRGKSFVKALEQFTFYYTPQDTPEKNGVTLFNFAANTGLTPAGSSAGDKVQLKINAGGLSGALDNFGEPDRGEGYQPGIFYRIPETAEVSLAWDDEVLGQKKVIINQFGKVRNLPNRDIKVELHPETGGIKSIIVK